MCALMIQSFVDTADIINDNSISIKIYNFIWNIQLFTCSHISEDLEHYIMAQVWDLASWGGTCLEIFGHIYKTYTS